MSTYIVNPTQEQEKAFRAFLEAMEVAFITDDEQSGTLPDYVEEGIKRGVSDFEAGRYIGLDDFKVKMSSGK